MHPLRFLILLFTSALGVILILYYGPYREHHSHFAQSELDGDKGISTYFNWRTPSSLFPPSAIISLTDDNSTFFLARPAAFGPLLPSKSMSGQLWVGNGFGDQHHPAENSISNGIMEGELGCSDVPGWSVAELNKAMLQKKQSNTDNDLDRLLPASLNDKDTSSQGNQRKKGIKSGQSKDPAQDVSDGTDDHLHHVKGSGESGMRQQTRGKQVHADIQSLQESAEIAGKVVMLTRGGCGFLDKVKWAQRRGATAVIIGDDIRGGPLVTMYARGDTSNISIPALFASHTTAHLLSSLMPAGGNRGIIPPEDSARLGVGLGDVKIPAKSPKSKADTSKSLTTSVPSKVAERKIAGQNDRRFERDSASLVPMIESGREESGWFWSMFVTRDAKRKGGVPPFNGDGSGWTILTEFEANEGKSIETDQKSRKEEQRSSQIKASPALRPPLDGFVIGVHDWRDPDLLPNHQENQDKRAATEQVEVDKSSSKLSWMKARRSASAAALEHGELKKPSAQLTARQSTETSTVKSSRTWFNRLFSGKQEEADLSPAAITNAKSRVVESAQPVSNPVHLHDIHLPGAMFVEPTEHDGLWVTLSPTSMSSSPFFDTLLVLVVSPLVTLTVVYALLLLRSRMRRRRWRAPKSVVERLPVRTYQTMASSPTSSTTSSISTVVNAQTPLLGASTPRPIRSRPRSRTDDDLVVQSSSTSQSLEQLEEKKEAGLAEWRRRYGGKQKECVVCLDEYVDGVSRVMSLPCGHEFHEGCITPWLTTRRRTCPICKGDVVRSMARPHESTSPAHTTIEEEDSDVIQEQAASLVHQDPTSQMTVSREDEAFEDLERGVVEHPDRDR